MGIAQYKSPAIDAHYLGTVTNAYRSRFKTLLEPEVSLGSRQEFSPSTNSCIFFFERSKP